MTKKDKGYISPELQELELLNRRIICTSDSYSVDTNDLVDGGNIDF